MSLRKIDESNVDVEPYTLNKKLFNEMIEFRVRKIFLFLPFLVSMKTGITHLSLRIDKPGRDSPAKTKRWTKRGRSRRTSIKQFARGGRAEERWAVVPSI